MGGPLIAASVAVSVTARSPRPGSDGTQQSAFPGPPAIWPVRALRNGRRTNRARESQRGVVQGNNGAADPGHLHRIRCAGRRRPRRPGTGAGWDPALSLFPAKPTPTSTARTVAWFRAANSGRQAAPLCSKQRVCHGKTSPLQPAVYEAYSSETSHPVPDWSEPS